MATLGHLNEFRPGQEKFSVYVERFELYVTVNGVKDEKKVPLFLTLLGGSTYGLLHDLFAPDNPKDKTYAEIVEKLKDHFEPAPLIIAQRFHFHRRNQAPGESIADYMAELRRLAASCEFQAYLEEALRDRLVCGLRSEAIQKRLLAEASPTLARVLEIAQTMEAANKGAQALKHSESLAVGKVSYRSFHGTNKKQSGGKPCYRCGKVGHAQHECGFREAICHACQKKGHLARVCKSSRKSRGPRKTQWVDTEPQVPSDPDPIESTEEVDTICHVTTKPSHPYKVVLQINGKPVTMEIDTGAVVTLIPQSLQESLFPGAKLDRPTLTLRTYTAQPIKLVGQMTVEVRYQGYLGQHILYVVGGQGPPLLGRDWLNHIRLNWASIKLLAAGDCAPAVKELTDRYADVFKRGLGTMQQIRATLSLKEGATSRFHRPRPVPFAIRDAVGRELDRLEEAGILRKVEHSDWAAPIVPVPKKDGAIRICGDYKVTINPELKVDQHPLPNPSELLASVTGGKHFTKLDLTSAYQQMLLDDDSARLATINTHKGLYEPTRLPFGVASAPALFQRAMDMILQGIPHVSCYLDDILVTGTSDSEHLQNLEEVLRRLRKHGVRLRLEKCAFFQERVEYLGHCIDQNGIRTSDKKVRAVQDARPPQNTQELRAFLGLVNYYAKFIPNLASLLHPLHELLRVDTTWSWSKSCEAAFTEAKPKLTSAPVLAHFNPELPVVLAADASPYGVGAVLSHVMPSGEERPIAYASRTLSRTECKYAQVEKEALALIFGVKRFHLYLYGRSFVLHTDHKPLTAIFGPKKGVPSLAAARMQRWALYLAGYSYEIRYRKGASNGNADCLSRLPLPTTNPDYRDEASVLNIAQLDALPVQAATVERATRSDPLLSKVLHHVRRGWPSQIPAELRPYWRRREELSIEGDCILLGTRVVVPAKLQSDVLQELHRGHPGIVRMKSLARSYVWWPHLDRQLEDWAKKCEACQAGRKQPPKAPLHPWAWPALPWQRVHVDFAGPVMGKMLLIATDAHSKWPEVHIMSTTTASKTIEVLRELFARYGLPEQLVSDNGPQFVSDEFKSFLRSNGVKHLRSPPYHPATNGAAERLVQTVKQALKSGCQQGVPLKLALATFLLRYRVTPHATTGVSPSTLFLGRTPRTRLDLLRKNVSEHVHSQQQHQKVHHDMHSRDRELTVGQSVWVRNMRSGPAWIRGKVVDILGPRSYLVQVREGELWRRHLDHLRDGSTRSPDEDTQAPQPSEPGIDIPEESNTCTYPTEPGSAASGMTSESSPSPSVDESRSSQDTGPVPQPLNGSSSTRYPTRVRAPPDRLIDSL